MYKEIESLVVLSKKDNKRAKEVLLNKLNPLIISSIRKYYNRADKYEDLVQDGYETILNCIHDYDPDKGAYFLGYVKVMLKYCYLGNYKGKQTLSLNEPLEDGELMDVLVGEEKDPVDIVVEREEYTLLSNSLYCLTDRQLGVVIDFYINGLSVGEIADKLDVSYRTVINTKTQAVKKLKNRIVK